MTVVRNLADFVDYDPATLRVRSRESKQREFKLTYDTAKEAKYLQTLAAFSNHAGGTLLFGICDKPHRLITGVSDQEFPDAADWQNKLRAHFDPAIIVVIDSLQIGDKQVLAVTVEASHSRPFICTQNRSEITEKNGKTQQRQVLQEGTIYYRYSASNDPIRFPEMSEMLRLREERHLKAFLQNVKIMNELGVDTVGLVSLKEGESVSPESKIFLSEEVARNLNLIDRGHFVDSEGERAFILAGTVHLNTVVTKPWDKEDKNLPDQAAKDIKAKLVSIYGDQKPFNFTGSHLAKVATWLGIRSDTSADPRYIIDEREKLNRMFYTRAGIEYCAKAIMKSPIEAVQHFGSKAMIAMFEAKQKTKPQ